MGLLTTFLAGKILIPTILQHKNCQLTVDKRNKETHSQKYFDGYIETKTLGDAFDKGIDVKLEIVHGESQIIYGLQAVDFFSWSVYRKSEKGDPSFFNLFEDIVNIKEEWYCQ